VALHQINEGTFPSLAALMLDISKQVTEYGSLGKIPAATVGNTRNDMYLVSEAIRLLSKDKESELIVAENGAVIYDPVANKAPVEASLLRRPPVTANRIRYPCSCRRSRC
jgi:hypothetical protein